jgi:hypothetical protein
MGEYHNAVSTQLTRSRRSSMPAKGRFEMIASAG